MGFHDKEEIGAFRLINGTLYDPTNENPDHLYNWQLNNQRLEPSKDADAFFVSRITTCSECMIVNV